MRNSTSYADQDSRCGNTLGFASSILVIQLYNENVSPDAGLHKKTNFSTLIIGLARDRTRAA
jgi:hypothetical protein